MKPKVLKWEGGVDIIEEPNGGWHDSQLKFDCVFFPDEAGVERCFPRALVVPKLFADSNCTRPVFAEDEFGGCREVPLRYVTADSGCTARGFQLGDELLPSTPLFFSKGAGSCEPKEPTGELGPVYALEALPAEVFVGMRRSARPRAPAIDAYVREGDDGSWQIMGFFDPAREAACFQSSPVFGSEPHCVPSSVSMSPRFGDPTCETRFAAATLRSCQVEQPTAMSEIRTDGRDCPPFDIQFYEIDGVGETTPHAIDDAGACVAHAEAPSESYLQGAAIDVSTLPRLESPVVGTGALHALFSGFGGIPYLPDIMRGLWLRDESGEVCSPYYFPDGSLRCIPISFPNTSVDFVYEDAACAGAPTLPWVGAGLCSTGAPVPVPRAVLRPERSSACRDGSSLREVLTVVGESSASTFYSKNAVTGACQLAAAPSGAPTYLQLGDALKASDFVELERTVRW